MKHNLHFTDIAVQRLGTGTHFDSSTPAFGIRVGKHRKTWFVIRGKDRARTNVGRYPEVPLAEARKEAKKLLTTAPVKTDNTRFGEAYEAYKLVIEGKKANTRKGYRYFLEKYYLPAFKTTRLPDITYEQVIALTKNLPKSVARNCLATGRTFFKWCQRPPRRYIAHSPLEGVELPKAKKRQRIYTPKEQQRTWKAAQQQGYPHGTIVQLLLATGQRRIEIANLRWPWISKRDRTITLPEWLCKNSKEHTFPYSDVVAQILETVPRLNSTDLLFPSRVSDERPLSGWSKYKKELNELGGIATATLHDLRRTMRTTHAQLGTPREIGERLINHAAAVQSDVESVYDTYKYLPEMRAAVAKYEEHLSALIAAA